MSHAIVGCGRVAGNHAYAAQTLGVQVSICYDIEFSKSSALAESYSIPTVAHSLAEVLDTPSIESVSICTDHGSHAALSIQALQQGKNVVVEKPMAISVPDALSMLEVADATGMTLAVISQHRYNPLVRELRRKIQDGVFGQIVQGIATLECHKSDNYYRDSTWRGTREHEGGSTLINQFIHTLDLLIWTFGAPTQVFGAGRTTRFSHLIETEDTFCGWIEFKNNLMVTLASTNCSTAHWNSRISLVGSDGSISFSTGHPVKVESFTSQNDAEGQVLSNLQEIEKSAQSRTPPTMSYYGTSHVEQLKDFFNAKQRNGSLQMPPTEALRTLAVVQALYRSAEVGKPIDFVDVSPPYRGGII